MHSVRVRHERIARRVMRKLDFAYVTVSGVTRRRTNSLDRFSIIRLLAHDQTRMRLDRRSVRISVAYRA